MKVLHFLFMLIMGGPVVLMIWGYIKGRKQALPEAAAVADAKYLPLVINSAVLYALAYNLVFFIQELFLALGKKWIGLKAFLYHNNHSWEGSDPKAALMQGSGALAIFISGIILLLVFRKIRRSNSWLKLFVLWLAYHGLIQSLPQLATAPVARNTDVGQALTYFQLNEAIDFGLAYGSIFAIIGLAWLFSRYFLEFAQEGKLTDHPFSRFKNQFQIAVLPALIGTMLIFPFRIPPLDRFTAAFMLLFVCLPALFGFSWLVKQPKYSGSAANNKIFIATIVLLVALLAFFQLVLAPGVVFYPKGG